MSPLERANLGLSLATGQNLKIKEHKCCTKNEKTAIGKFGF